MYWNNSNSTIDTLLSQEGVTLVSIINDDDVLQECIGQNTMLLAFLSDDTHLTEMLTVLLSEPEETTNDMESRYKNANTVCEILTYDGNMFVDIIVKNDKYLSQLWSFVSLNCSQESQDGQSDSNSQTTQPLNPLLASFFTKVFTYLFTHKIDQVLDFLARQESPNDLVSVILRHINTSAIMDFVYKTWDYMNTDKKIEPEKIQMYNNLLLKNCFIEKLIEIFKDPTADSKQQNAANLISDLVKTGRELLLHNNNNQDKNKVHADGILEEFEKTDISRNLLQNMFESQTKYSVASGLKIIQDLLVYRIQMQQLINQHYEQLSSMDGKRSDVQDDNLDGMPTFLKASSSPSSNEVQFMPPQLSSPVDVHGEHLSRCVRNVCAALCERLDDFIDLLVNPKGLSPIASTVGVIDSPLGLIRLEVIHLFVALFATSDFTVLEKCAQLDVLQILTDLFFKYSLNNQLHKYYEQIIEYLFQNYSNFKNIYDKYSANEGTNNQPNDVSAKTDSSSDGEKVDINANSSEENSKEAPGNNNNAAPLNNEKILYFIKLFKMTEVLVKQVITNCRLVEKILDSFAQEAVPLKSSQKQPDTPKVEESLVDSNGATQPVTTESEPSVAPEQIKLEELEGTIKLESIDSTETKQVSDVTSEPEAVNIECETKPETNQAPPMKPRPGYLGHLRLIANVLKERCTDELLNECQIDSQVIKQWNEFKTGQLAQLNELINSKLVEESKFNESNDQDIFHKYQIESLTQNLPSNIELLPSDLGQSSLTESLDQVLDKQINLMREFDFNQRSSFDEKLGDLKSFEKYFSEKYSSIFDDEDDDSLNGTSENPVGSYSQKEWPSLLTTTLTDDFAAFDDSYIGGNDSKVELECFAEFDKFCNMDSNPWADSSNQAETPKEAGQSPTWAADFSNEPFGSSDTAANVATDDAEVRADFSTNLPNTSSPKKEEEQ